jgi:hypothetical protein
MIFKKQNSQHVTIVVDLEIGDKVRVIGHTKALDNKICIIEDIDLSFTSQSGVCVKIDLYDSWLDSDWITKI